MSIFWTVLAIVVVLLVILSATLFAVGMVEGWQAERRRQRILAEKTLSEARIQMHTTQAAQAMYDAARDAMPGTSSTTRCWVERVDGDGRV